MLASFEQTETDQRLYFGRGFSVVSYFTPRPDGQGCELHLEHGFHAYPQIFEMQKDDVRRDVLAEAARRLGVTVDQVLAIPFSRLQAIADPECPEQYRFARRRRTRFAR